MITFLQIDYIHTNTEDEKAGKSKHNFDNRLTKEVILATHYEAKEGRAWLEVPLHKDDLAEQKNWFEKRLFGAGNPALFT